MATSDRHRQRLALGRGAVFSLMRAAELLPLDDKEARVWLRAEHLVTVVCGREVVVWDAVLERLRGVEVPSPPQRAAPTQLRRANLD